MLVGQHNTLRQREMKMSPLRVQVVLFILTLLHHSVLTIEYDEQTMLKKFAAFSNNGYAFMENVLPELRSDLVQEQVRLAMTLAKLEFTIACEERLVLSYNVNCSLINYPMCPIKWTAVKKQIQTRMRAIIVSRSVADFTSDYFLFEKGLKSLTCCITETNKLLGKNTTSDEGIRLPYIQFLNLHRTNKAVMELALNKRLGEMAAFLLDERRVRLYQTAVFHKHGNLNQTDVGTMLNRQTHWHTDLNMVPLDTSTGGYLTFWCPLTTIASNINDSLLLFAKKSHRDMSSNYWFHEISGTISHFQDDKLFSLHDAIVNRYEISVYDQISVGSCTVHDGWLYHSANSQIIGARDRIALAFSFVSAEARVLPAADSEINKQILRRERHEEDHWSYKDWFQHLAAHAVIDHPLLPLAYDSTNASFVADTSIMKTGGRGQVRSNYHDGVKSVKDGVRSKIISVQAIKKNTPKVKTKKPPDANNVTKLGSKLRIIKVLAIRKDIKKKERSLSSSTSHRWRRKISKTS